MNIKDYLLMVVALSLLIFGQIMAKIGASYPTIINVFVLLGYLALLMRGLVWIAVLNRLPISFAYPILSVSFVLILIASYLVFDEPISLFKVLGSLLIIAGVVFTSMGQKAGEDR